MSITQNSIQNVGNFLVPAAGQTHCVRVEGSPFTDSPYLIDWRQFTVDNFPFAPQGIYIDNSKSTTDTTVIIQPLGYPITCPAGAILSTPFPAPNGQSAQIISPGSRPTDVTNVYFVDYPVFPFFLDPNQITGSQPVIISGIDTGNALNVTPAQMAVGNVPYRVQEYAAPSQIMQGNITGAATSINLTPVTANMNCRKIQIALSGDATLTAAGEITLTVAANGNTVYKRTLALLAAAPAQYPPSVDVCLLDFDTIAIPMAAGNLTVSLSSALATGILDVNACFTAA